MIAGLSPRSSIPRPRWPIPTFRSGPPNQSELARWLDDKPGGSSEKTIASGESSHFPPFWRPLPVHRTVEALDGAAEPGGCGGRIRSIRPPHLLDSPVAALHSAIESTSFDRCIHWIPSLHPPDSVVESGSRNAQPMPYQLRGDKVRRLRRASPVPFHTVRTSPARPKSRDSRKAIVFSDPPGLP